MKLDVEVIRIPIRGLRGRWLNFLSKQQIYDMHLAVLEVLECIGVRVETDLMLKMFHEGGGYVDFKKRIVRFPEYMVEEAIHKAPKRVVLMGRKPQYDVILEDNRICFGLGGSPKSRILDLESGILREPLKKDVEDGTRLGDALEKISFIQNLAQAMDVPKKVQYDHVAQAMFNNTEKHLLITAPSAEEAERIIRMASVVEEAFGRKPISIYSGPASPLMLTASQENIIVAAEKGLPIVLCNAPMAGATAPVTLAGAVVQNIAENLSALILSQLVKPGIPVVLGSTSTVMDPRTGSFSLGAPELMLEQVMSAQMSHYYGLPYFGCGCCSDSKTFDVQAAVEAAMTGLTAALGGLNMIQDVGVIDLDDAGCFELAVLSEEIIGIIERILRGFSVDDEALALDVIAEVGPGGHFLAHRHTLKFVEEEIYLPRLFDRRSEGDWFRGGAKDLRDVIRERAKKILKEHQPEPLPKHVQKKLDYLVKETERKVLGAP